MEKRKELGLIYPDAAGIDIGSEVHYVCVPEGRSSSTIQKFGCFTEELHRLADWLKSCRIKTVAMESTGVYWIPLFQVLESRGFEVLLVNAQHVKNVPGRKSDVQDCQWIQRLHSCGLLRGSFRPDDTICVLRSYMRQRGNLIRSMTVHIQRMQKALTEMNVQLHKVITDITGITGMAIITAILQGERDPDKLAALRDSRTKNDSATIAQALRGDWREEHLFTLSQEFDLYHFYQKKIMECDQQITQRYQQLETHQKADGSGKGTTDEKPASRKKSGFDWQTEMYRVTGIDFTKIPGLNTLTVQTLIAEVGLNPDKWPTEKHFVSWLGLSPANKITGEKIISSRTRRVNNRAARALRLAAYGVARSKTSLGNYFRRLKSRLGAPKAITATARKLGCIFYNLLKHGQEYVEKGLEYDEKQFAEKVFHNLSKKAKQFGFVLTKTEEPVEQVS
jgi:transposase